MDIDAVRERVRAGRYLIKRHAIEHALKEGFERVHMVEAITTGKIIEEYPDDRRVLVCGLTSLATGRETYLHVVCEYADEVYVEFVTAYIPDETEWEHPPYRRRRHRK